MSTSFQSDERSAQIVGRASTLLMKLLDSHGLFLISSKSFLVLIQGFSTRLADAIKEGTEEQLLRYWEEQLPAFSQRLLSLAMANQIRGADGVMRPLLTEKDADRLLLACFPPGPSIQSTERTEYA